MSTFVRQTWLRLFFIFFIAIHTNTNHTFAGQYMPTEDIGLADAAPQDIDDPFESFNRGVFEFNMALDTVLFRPLAELYGAVVMDDMRNSVHNALTNLGAPVVFINDVLQLNGGRAAETFARFLINSTVGIVGLFDVAGEIGIHHHSEDFGQTLGAAGIGGGPYLIIPILGSSNPRDLIGRVVDFFIDPFNIIMDNNDWEHWIWIRVGADFLDQRTLARSLTDSIDKSLDPYAKYRSLYIQNRKFKVRNEVPDTSESPRPYEE